MLTDNWQVTLDQGHQVTLTFSISEGLNLNAFSYQRAQQQQENFSHSAGPRSAVSRAPDL